MSRINTSGWPEEIKEKFDSLSDAEQIALAKKLGFEKKDSDQVSPEMQAYLKQKREKREQESLKRN